MLHPPLKILGIIGFKNTACEVKTFKALLKYRTETGLLKQSRLCLDTKGLTINNIVDMTFICILFGYVKVVIVIQDRLCVAQYIVD